MVYHARPPFYQHDPPAEHTPTVICDVRSLQKPWLTMPIYLFPAQLSSHGD